MTISLEKIFFAYILQNKKYFEIVEPHWFKNAQIKIVYDVVRKYVLKDIDIAVPPPKQIWEMVSLNDKDELVTKDSLKNMLTVNLADYHEKDFLIPKLNLFILANRIKNSASEIIDETRNVDSLVEFDDALVAANKIKDIVNDLNNINFVKDDDLGSDFDEAEAHVQDNSKFKVKSGFDTLDHLLGGGWDIQTLNCIMAETNNGKCFFVSTKCHIRSKINGKTARIEVGDLLSNISQGHNNI